MEFGYLSYITNNQVYYSFVFRFISVNHLFIYSFCLFFFLFFYHRIFFMNDSDSPLDLAKKAAIALYNSRDSQGLVHHHIDTKTGF